MQQAARCSRPRTASRWSLGLLLVTSSLALVGGEAAAQSQPGWVRARGSAGLGQKVSHAMAYDVARQRTVLFGGHHYYSFYRSSDPWEWDGS